MKSAKFIHVADGEVAEGAGGLFLVLESLLPVRFARDGECSTNAVGQINSVSRPPASEVRIVGLPRLMLPAFGRAHPVQAPHSSVRFADDPLVPWPFRGQTVATRAKFDAHAQASLPAPGDRALAFTGDDLPIWTVNEHGGARTYRTSLCMPHAPQGCDVGVAAAGDRFIQTLPLFQFVRELTDQQRLNNPPLRAAYIIDDPNLHWPRYGFADYRSIAASARQDHYHVAFATIPLDAWWVHRGTASIFRAHTDGLSLLVHGNNHAKQELAQDLSSHACSALLVQADQRIRQLEAKSGLQVCRVMVPPHGACSSRMLAQLPQHGFESACISAGSLRAHNTAQAWTRSLGLGPGELIENCPVLPRWAFSGTTNMTLLTAAYLGQPLILRGHHQDLKDGIDIFRGFARTINSLGDVCWGKLSNLSRLNYRHRIDGRSMQVQPLGTRIDVSVPDDVDEIRFDTGGFEWQATEPEGLSGELDGAEWVVPLKGGRSYSFARRMGDSAGSPQADLDATSAKLILRRVLTEARDRLRVS